MRQVSLIYKINFVLLVVFILFFSIILFINTENNKKLQENAYLNQGIAIGQVLDANIQDTSVLLDKSKMLLNINKLMWLNPEIVKIDIILNETGEFITYISNDPNMINSVPSQESKDAFSQNKIINSVVIKQGKRILIIVTPIHVSGQTVGIYQIDFTLENVDNQLQKNLQNQLISYIPIMLICFIFLTFLLRRILLNPLFEFNSAINSISRGDFNFKINIHSKDEFGQLSEGLIRMSSELKIAQQKNEAHENSLTQTVNEKTKEIKEEIEELEKTKAAVLNILEDTDDTNKELAFAQKSLSEKVAQLEDMSKKKDEFLSITAHELKTPLTSIRGFTSLLKNDVVIKNKEMREKYFTIILDDTERLGKLITDILDLSRLDLGTMKFNIEKIPAGDLISGVKDLCDLAIKAKKVKPIYYIEQGLPILLTDKSRIVQVLANLANNSIKYTEKGSIKLEAFKDTKSKEIVHFRVTDTGVGIPIDAQPRMFERFYQADSSYTRKVGGSGLGLSICKGIVEALGGKIWFKSTPGKGTMFEFSLPINPPNSDKTQNINILNENIKK